MTLLLLLVPFSTLLPFSTFHQIATAAAPTGVIVPLYTYLGSTWDTVIAAKNAHPNVPIVVIANLEGPGPSQDPAFLTGIQKLQAAGIVVIGYVDTLYGARSSTIVKSEIDAWKGWYNVNGIFFDEMANWSGGESYYSSLNSYVKLKGMTITVGNPGIDTLPSYIGTVDNMMIYESAGLPSITSLQGWHTSYDKSNFSIIPFGVNTLDTSYATSASNYLGYIYITNDNLPNPWDSLPPYFGNLVAALDTGAIPPPSDTILPSVSITSPATGATVSDLISISVSATDNVAVSKVQLSVDNVFNAEDTTNPYSFTFDTKTLSNGSHVLKATGIDTSNNAASSSITVNVNNIILPPPPPQLNPIANWKFEDNALDSSGNGNNGILMNGPTFVAGKIGKAVNFDGVDDYVSVSDTNSLTPGTQATFVAWVFPRAIDEDYDGVISKWDGTDEDEYLVGFQTSRAISFAWHTTGCISSCGAQYGTGAYNDLTSTLQVTLNAWNHVAVTRDGTTLTFYLNGNNHIITNAFDTNPFRNGVVPLKVGAENSGLNNRHINGIVDEVAIWNRALSATEIQSLFADSLVPNPPTALTATAVSSSQVNLSWTAPTGTVTGYEIERAIGIGPFSVLILNTGTAATIYSDTGLAHSTTYTYRVSAINSVGTSSPSNIASATTFNVVSSPPTGLTATAISSSQINLSWTAPTDNGGSPVTGYKIERESPVGGVFSTIVANTGTTAVTYSDTGLAASTVYNYRVSAINSEGISSPSNEASATTFNLPPPPSDTILPSVSITSPATGATVSDLISISVSATDNVAVSKVQLSVDNVFNAEDTTNPYSFTLDTKTLSNGSHVLKATGIDTSNNAASSSITVNINNTTPPNPPPTPLPRLDLIANWKFKNNTLDSSGNGNNGILMNGPTFVAGKIGKAVNLDGVDDYVSVNDGNTLTPGTQATFMAWVFPRAIDEDYDGVISKWDGTDEDEYLVGLQTSRAISFAWHTTGCISSCEAQYGTGAYNDVVSTIKVKLNTWNFIAVARDGTTLTFYNATHSQTFSNAFDSNPFRNGITPLKVGAENSGSNNRHINGIIDEVAIWNRALSATEIQLIAYSQQ